MHTSLFIDFYGYMNIIIMFYVTGFESFLSISCRAWFYQYH